jgi:anti-anti-sigma factor
VSFVDGSVRVDRLADSLFVVGLHGEHDLSTVADLRGELTAIFAQGATVVVDLSEATFIDSSVLSELILVQRRVENDQDRQLAIVAPRGRFPARVIDMADSARLFAIFERRGDALRWANTGAGAT